MEKQLTQEEIAQKEKEEMVNYAKSVADEASDYQQNLIQAEKDKIENEKLARMGMEGEPVAVQLKPLKTDKNLSLAQI